MEQSRDSIFPLGLGFSQVVNFAWFVDMGRSVLDRSRYCSKLLSLIFTRPVFYINCWK